MRIFITGRVDDPEALSVEKEVYIEVKSHGYTAILDKELGKLLGIKGTELSKAKPDIVVSVGGDGTLLKVAHRLLNLNIDAPLLGVKYGHIGFLCEMKPENFWEGLARLQSGDYWIETKRLLKAVWDDKEAHAINEVLLLPVVMGRVIKLSISKNGELIYEGRCDGAMLSTSIGSTAYLASRGGPIIDPELEVIVLDVLNPLLWGQRMIILPINSNIELVSNKNIQILIDGNVIGILRSNNKLYIRVSEKVIKFVRFGRRFYEKLRKRITEEI